MCGLIPLVSVKIGLPFTFSIYEGDYISNEACINIPRTYTCIYTHLYTPIFKGEGGTTVSVTVELGADVASYLIWSTARDSPLIYEGSHFCLLWQMLGPFKNDAAQMLCSPYDAVAEEC